MFVVENDVAIRRPVETGFSNEGLIEITSGLTDDELVVTVGQIGLKPDAKVTVINADDSDELNVAEKSDIQVSDNAPTD